MVFCKNKTHANGLGPRFPLPIWSKICFLCKAMECLYYFFVHIQLWNNIFLERGRNGERVLFLPLESWPACWSRASVWEEAVGCPQQQPRSVQPPRPACAWFRAAGSEGLVQRRVREPPEKPGGTCWTIALTVLNLRLLHILFSHYKPSNWVWKTLFRVRSILHLFCMAVEQRKSRSWTRTIIASESSKRLMQFSLAANEAEEDMNQAKLPITTRQLSLSPLELWLRVSQKRRQKSD